MGPIEKPLEGGVGLRLFLGVDTVSGIKTAEGPEQRTLSTGECTH